MLSPIQGAIETVRLLISNRLVMNSSLEENIENPPFISPLPPQYQAPPTIPGSGTLPPLINDGISVLPPFNPIGPYNPPSQGSGGLPQDQNDIPDDIRELLG